MKIQTGVVLAALALLSGCSESKQRKSSDFVDQGAVAEDSKKLVKECSAHLRPEATIRVSRTVYSKCENRKDDHYDFMSQYLPISTRYTLVNRRGQIDVILPSIHFYPEVPTSSDFADLRQKILAALPCVQSFFAKHGLNLKYEQILFEDDAAIHPEGDISISVSGKPGRSTSGAYNLVGSDQEICRAISHETGHLFGLPDRYSEGSCPDREISLTTNVMGFGELSGANLLSSDVRLILEPICEPSATQESLKDSTYVENLIAHSLDVQTFTSLKNDPFLGFDLMSRVPNEDSSVEPEVICDYVLDRRQCLRVRKLVHDQIASLPSSSGAANLHYIIHPGNYATKARVLRGQYLYGGKWHQLIIPFSKKDIDDLRIARACGRLMNSLCTWLVPIDSHSTDSQIINLLNDNHLSEVAPTIIPLYSESQN